jgi:hypothetical protein
MHLSFQDGRLTSFRFLFQEIPAVGVLSMALAGGCWLGYRSLRRGRLK